MFVIPASAPFLRGCDCNRKSNCMSPPARLLRLSAQMKRCFRWKERCAGKAPHERKLKMLFVSLRDAESATLAKSPQASSGARISARSAPLVRFCPRLVRADRRALNFYRKTMYRAEIRANTRVQSHPREPLHWIVASVNDYLTKIPQLT